MKPSDLIEWIYAFDRQAVDKDEMLWSILMRQWVPVGSDLFHVLIAIDNEKMTWLNEKGLFHTRVDDTHYLTRAHGMRWVIPHVRG